MTALALWLVQAAPALAQQQQGPRPEIGVGASYITGTYGQPGPDTSVVYAPLTATLRSPTWRLEATVPYIQIHGPDNVAGAEGAPVVVGDGSSRRSTRGGLGDVILGAGTYLPRTPNLPLIDVSAKVKLPTAGTELGTGRADVSAQFAVYQPLTPKLLLMGSVGYQWLGRSDRYDLRSGPAGMIGFNYKTTPSIDAGATLNFTSRLAESLDHELYVSPYVAWRASRRWGLTAYALAGLTRSSPSGGGGVQLTFYR
ncbi:MAG: transporter [Caulobacteraceae bacterium]